MWGLSDFDKHISPRTHFFVHRHVGVEHFQAALVFLHTGMWFQSNSMHSESMCVHRHVGFNRSVVDCVHWRVGFKRIYGERTQLDTQMSRFDKR